MSSQICEFESSSDLDPDKGSKQPKFSSLKSSINSETLQAVKAMGFKRMTLTQAVVLPKILEGSDVCCTAQTGSGKTLAFLIPAIKAVIENKLTSSLQGTSCIILSPTRELAMQTHSVLRDLTVGQGISSCLVIGGENRYRQAEELKKGVDVIVGTPGRLHDHMRSEGFTHGRLTCLVLDEADKMQQYGFEEEVKSIISMLPRKRQTLMFSATRNEKTESLMKLAMNESVEHVSVGEDKATATVEGLKHGYVICPTEERLWWLFAVLKRTRRHKVMVFFSSCSSVQFHFTFFRNHCKAPVTCIHGKLAQPDRCAAIEGFHGASRGALLCTDVAARGLDIPAVDWIIQYDPPGDTSEYIHRVGRTARGVNSTGHAVLLLRPEEAEFLQHLREARLCLDSYKMWDEFDNLQPMLEKAISEDAELKQLATEAYEGYVRAFEVRRLKTVFDLRSLDLDAVSKSFGLAERPSVDIRVGFKKKHRPRKRQMATLDNPDSRSKKK